MIYIIQIMLSEIKITNNFLLWTQYNIGSYTYNIIMT